MSHLELKTGQLFTLPEEFMDQREAAMAAPIKPSAGGLQPIPHDTVEITVHYLQRPKHMTHFSLGRWFNLAHELKDSDLDHCITSIEAKRLIVKKQYNQLDLAPLIGFNAGER